ncbi:hypothetical protein [Aquimarina sp. MAR_2010_214]|uniref:hypothetical protein n=1 Tax=Aquimarina sp. MAR_2010_214 TaxID=1250026 RepID=UPI001178283F|nr:hypothetical protein [Aquimarina sp. MAR_2010_214]
MTTICYISFQYYSNYKKKENYKRVIVAELKSGLWFIEEVFNKDIDVLKKEIDSHFRSFLEGDSNLNEQELWRLRIEINSSFMGLQSPSEYLRNESWKSSKQSGILAQFSIHELEQLNLAHSRRKKLIETEKISQKFGFISPSFNTTFSREISKIELEIIYRKYQKVLLDYSSIARRTSFEYSNAMNILDPENKYLKHLDSLRLIQTSGN